MFSEYSYPMICAKNFTKTVNFYEDYFEFEPTFEMAGFTVLKRRGQSNMYLAIIDAQHDVIPKKYRTSTKGLILNFPVDDSKTAYERLYLEGLTMISEPSDALCGRKHFFVEDPNGVLIDVAENIPLEKLIHGEKMEDLFVVV